MGELFRGPPQGWAALRWEVGVVFVGIVLALTAQQLADTLYWRGQASQAKRAIEQELLQHEADGYERLAVQHCLRGQLVALSQRLAAHRGEWRAMPMIVQQKGDWQATQMVVPSAYRAPIRLWPNEAWETARSSGALNHLPDRTVAAYAEAYTLAMRNFRLQQDEDSAASKLVALAVDGPISDGARIELLGALSQIDRANSGMENATIQELDILRPLLNHVPRQTREAGVAKRMKDQRGFRGECVESLKFKP